MSTGDPGGGLSTDATVARTHTALTEIAQMLTTEFDLATVLYTITAHVRAAFDAESAALILLDPRRVVNTGNRLHVVADTTRAGAPIMDPALHLIGPGRDSAAYGAVAMADDLTDDNDARRWPDYRSRALSTGIRAVRAYPVSHQTLTVGSLIVHIGGPWNAALPDWFGRVLAHLAAISLTFTASSDPHVGLADTIDSVLYDATVLSTAIGITAEVLGVEPEVARARISSLAGAHDVTETQYAQRVLTAQRKNPRDPTVGGVFTDPAHAFPPVIGLR